MEVRSRIEKNCWFAARTRCGAELGVQRRLHGLSIENFLPTEHRTRTRGRTQYEKPLIPGIIFVYTTKPQACALANEMGVPVRYMTDPATRTLLVVPDKQMEDFRRVLDLSVTDGGLIDRPLALGDHVRVVKGVLTGVEGWVVDFKGKTYVVVELLGCLFARASVPRAWLELIDKPLN